MLGMAAEAPPRAGSVRYELMRDLDMVCGGAVTLFYEPSIGRRWQIVFFGAGHVVQATVPLVATLDCEITCIDTRSEWLSRLPKHDAIEVRLVTDMVAAVRELPLGAFVLSITQGHATDLPIVRELLAWGEASFIGVIGSEQKARTLRAALAREGLSPEAIESVRCPLGLPIGSNEPAEIAISIAAQLLAERDARVGVVR
jgi:xanthine dehydrogenase accessory factor